MADQKNIIHKNKNKLSPAPNLLDYDKIYKNFSWEKAAKEEIDFFPDGTLNIAYNCIDRHAKGKKKNTAALLFTGANGEKEQYTFGDLKKLTDTFANVLVAQ